MKTRSELVLFYIGADTIFNMADSCDLPTVGAGLHGRVVKVRRLDTIFILVRARAALHLILVRHNL